jgi:hypothetical protein
MAPSSQEPSSAARAERVLSTFFSAPNAFRRPLASEKSGDRQGVPASVVPSILRYEKGMADRPVLLPFALEGKAEVCWLACAHDELAGRQLRDEMMAFVGPSFALFEGDGFTLSADQEAAKTAVTQAGLHVVAFLTSKWASTERAVQSWQRYWQLLDQRPPRPRQDLRSFNQLRAAFDRALVARNEKDALAAMTALRDQHGLSAENRTFLDVRLNAAFGRWDKILAHPQWDDILQVRLPPETYGDIWEALYEIHLADVEATGSARQLVTAFADRVRIPAAALLKSRGRSRRPSALKGFLLHELSLDNPSAELCASLLEQLGPNAFGFASEDLAEMAAALRRKSGFEEALTEMELERYEQAIALLVPLTDSIEVLQAQFRCAKEVADPESARSVLQRLASADSEIGAAVRTSRARLIADVEKISAQSVPTSLQAQIAECTSPAGVDDVVTYWRELIQSPEAAERLADADFVRTLVSTIEDFALDDSSVFESLLPIWFDWLVVRNPPGKAYVRVYLAFIEAIEVRDQPGDSEREMVRLALRHSLIAGFKPSEYTETVDRLSNLLPGNASLREITWALDIADLLLTEPCRDEEARLRWITKALLSAGQAWSRLSLAERCLATALSHETQIGLNLGSNEAEGDEAPESSHVSARIYLYSLDALAISRAARVLANALPHAKIDMNSDETCTPKLRAGTKNADWVVFVSSVATHQAFYCIKSAIRPSAALLQVEGSGTTRIVERVVRQAQMAPALTSNQP